MLNVAPPPCTVRVTTPVYVPAAREVVFALIVKTWDPVAVEPVAGVTLSQEPVDDADVVKERLAEPVAVTVTRASVAAKSSKVIALGYAFRPGTVMTRKETGSTCGGKPEAVTVTVPTYVPGGSPVGTMVRLNSPGVTPATSVLGVRSAAVNRRSQVVVVVAV
jgi:hypothetical protein